jgi:penicillin-binding protein 1A
VGGPNFRKHPFNLATQGHRQPGSSFKPFTLAVALQKGISVNSVWESRKKIFTVPRTGGKEFFIVNNYENSYAGSRSLADAMVSSDNSVYAELGIKVGTAKIAKLANRMGVRSPISTNYAVTLGGLKEGVSPLDMAHAYETFSTGGVRIDSANGLGGTDGGPVGIESIKDHSGHLLVKNDRSETRVMSRSVADTVSSVLQSVVSSGTGKSAATGGFAAGKTGTTENYGDAWFVGWNEKYTVAVWVGYPDKVKSMSTDYSGGPVAGGTFPAEIWHNFITSALTIIQTRASAKTTGAPANQTPTDGAPSDGNQTYPSYSGGTGGGSTGGSGGGNSSGNGGGGSGGGGSGGGSGGGGSGGGGSGGGSGSSGGSGGEGGSGPTG